MIFKTSGEVNYFVRISIPNVPEASLSFSGNYAGDPLAVEVHALPNITFLFLHQNASRGMFSYPIVSVYYMGYYQTL